MYKIITTFFGSGLSPWAPGTMGSLAALFLWVPLLLWVPHEISVISLIAVFMLGLWATNQELKTTGLEDPSYIVIDEVAGLGVTLIAFQPTMVVIVLGFLLFRLFDITKPWPIGFLDRKVHNAFGVMIDDIVAGIYAAVILFVVQTWIL